MVQPLEIERMYNILASFLGEAKNGYESSSEEQQYQFPCPRCVEKYGSKETHKFNLEVNLKRQVFHCWKCSDDGDEEMKGSVIRLIKIYGNTQLFKEYKECLRSLRDSSLYSLGFASGFDAPVLSEDLKLPCGYKPIVKDKRCPTKAMEYLTKRGIDWRIINEYRLGFTDYHEECKTTSNRIVIPSNDKYGELNYWTGRDFTSNDKRMKYMNPKVDRKDIIFNEDKIEWDADVTLVEGPFDHIVVPNSVPLLGKSLNTNFKLYWEIVNRANGKVLIFLDGDAYDNVKEIYALLNHGRLYNKIRYVPVNEKYDPSLLFQEGGRKAIIDHLRGAKQIPEETLY